jgi:DNA-binding MarR family transcriptional regulator
MDDLSVETQGTVSAGRGGVLHSPFARPEDSIGYLLWHTMHDWQRQLDQQLAPLGMSHVQFILMACTARLTAQDQPVSQARIAAYSRFDPMLVSKVLRTIESRGLLRRDADPDDTRCKRVELTPQGWATLERAFAVVKEAHQHHFARLGEDGDELRRLLRRLMEIGPPED